jgi:hypothetical protein
MILKGSQRGGGQDLAVHLMRLDDNEHIDIHEMRGFAGETLSEAFREAEAVSRATKCRQYLFSLSLSPPADKSVPVEAFRQTIEQIEQRLGLEGQPRAIVFHEKDGRRHAHCVWSRIDAETMTARHLSFFKSKLMSVSRELYLANGWELPRGLENPAERNPTNFTLAEWQQAKRQGIDPRWLKQTMQGCWQRSDGIRAFEGALAERGLLLARGDRRGFVVLDHHGEVWSLPRMLGLKTKEVRSRLGTGENLRSVEDTRRLIGERMTPAIRRHISEARKQFAGRIQQLATYRTEMTRLHREGRSRLAQRQSVEWDQETLERSARLPKGLRGLWHRLTGRYQKIRAANEVEALATRQRHTKERDTLIQQQLGQRAALQEQVRDVRRQQAEQLLELRADAGRYLRFGRGEAASERAPGHGLGLTLSR